jgi:hypothetical protein
LRLLDLLPLDLDEAVRMRLVSGIEHGLALGQDGRGLPEMNHGRGEHSDAGVAVLFVVPLEKLLPEGAAVWMQPKPRSAIRNATGFASSTER